MTTAKLRAVPGMRSRLEALRAWLVGLGLGLWFGLGLAGCVGPGLEPPEDGAGSVIDRGGGGTGTGATHGGSSGGTAGSGGAGSQSSGQGESGGGGAGGSGDAGGSLDATDAGLDGGFDEDAGATH